MYDELSKMQISSHYTVETIVEAQVAFSVPIFQRLFVWEEEQTRQLLEDLKKEAVSSEKKPYYIGVITVQKKSDYIWHIIDGQQRMTFLTLLGAELGWDDFVFGGADGADEKQLRINYVGREKDEEDIKNLATMQYAQVANVNFRRFHSVFQEFTAKQDFEREAFSSYVKKYCAFLISELPANYNPLDLNLFFEKMNSTGRQLSPVEVIKGKYFAHYANTWNLCMDFEEKYVAHKLSDEQMLRGMTLGEVLTSPMEYQEGEKIEGSENKTQLHLNRLVMRPEVLLLHVLKMTLKSNGKSSDFPFDFTRLVEIFKANESSLNQKDTEGKPGTKDKFISKLEAYRKWLDDNIIYLHLVENSYEYKFRSEDSQDAEEPSRKKLKQYQGMLYVSSGDAQEWVYEAYTKLNGSPLTLESLRQQNKERHNALPAYEEMTYGKVDRYWFWALDYTLWEMAVDNTLQVGFPEIKADLETIKAYRFRRNRSIEHLHPQNPQISQETSEWLKDRNESKDLVRNSFGNLAMISASFNSSQGNDSVGVKFARVNETQIPNKTLESIKLLLMFRAAGGDDKNWTPQVAKDHGQLMYDKLKAEYNHA